MTARLSAGRGRLLSIAFMLAALGIGAASLHGHSDQTVDALGQLHPPVLLGAASLMIVGLGLAMMSWRVVLAEMGSRLDLSSAAQVFFVGQLGKYLPGAVWPAVAQAQMGRALGVAPARMVIAFVINLAVSVLTGLTVGMLVVTQLLGDSAVWLAIPALAVVGCLVRPGSVERLVAYVLRVTRRGELAERVTRRGIRSAVAISLAGWLVTGLAVWLVAISLGAPALPALVACVGGTPLATVVGSLVVFAPGGAGAREAMLVLALSTVLPAPKALVVVITSRVLSLLADAFAAGVAALINLLHRSSPTARGALDAS